MLPYLPPEILNIIYDIKNDLETYDKEIEKFTKFTILKICVKPRRAKEIYFILLEGFFLNLKPM